MRLLLIHQGFPGQFGPLLPRLREQGHQLHTICPAKIAQRLPEAVEALPYAVSRGNGANTHPLALETETKVLRGEAVATVAATLQGRGYQPDLILGHPGWGEMLFLGDVWPAVPQLHYVEFFHGVPGTDNDLLDRYATPQTWEEKARSRMKNANSLLNLNQMAWGVSPTRFQHSLLPSWAQARTSIIHDGIDTGWLCPDPEACLSLPSGLVLRAGDPVITFINRTFEPYRGIHVLLEALVQLQRAHPLAQVLLVGKDTPNVSYGAQRGDGRGWLTALREDLSNRLDWQRIHPLGLISHTTLRQVYRISAAHVYLTYPFVLSWSLLEAMSCGCMVIGSDTAPVRELVRHGDNGLLVPFGDPEPLAHTLLKALREPEALLSLRQQARADVVMRYNRVHCQAQWLATLDMAANLTPAAIRPAEAAATVTAVASS